MVSRHGLEHLDEGDERISGLAGSEDPDELEDAEVPLEPDAEVPLEPDAEEADDGAAASLEPDDDSEQASLDELLAQRSAARRLDDDADDDSDVLSFPPQLARTPSERTPVTIAPVRDRQEFVCKSCHLIKPRVQLADEGRGLCRDCA